MTEVDRFFSTPQTIEAAPRHILLIEQAVKITEGDALYAGEILRSRIVTRTAQGMDADGSPFTPYSPDYERKKAAKLGRADVVNLFGPDHHPHMMNAMVVRAGDAVLGPQESASNDPDWAARPAHLFEIGFYGEEADRARAHNEGAQIRTRQGRGSKPDHRYGVMKQKRGGKLYATLPQRKFFAASQADAELMQFAIKERIERRLQAIGK